MSISENEKKKLLEAIESYSYPKKTYDFQAKREIQHPSMRHLESSIRKNLTSGDSKQVKNGLSNVLYWGFYQMGYRDRRVRNFRNGVAEKQLKKSAKVLCDLSETGLLVIKNLDLPQFSNIPFLSKVRMFLNPKNYVVLDKKLMKLKYVRPPTLFHKVKEYSTIPCTKRNVHLYQRWCDVCKKTAKKYFQTKKFFAVDIERGIYHMVGEDLNKAAGIVSELEANCG